MKRFQDLLVVELAGSVAGAYAGKLFSDLGAGVVRVESPDADTMRREGSHFRSHDYGSTFAYLNSGKQSVALDTSVSTGRAILERIVGFADIVIESSSPDPLHPVSEELKCSDGLVRLLISPFGLSGPYARYRSTPFTDYAAGGQMYLNGEPDREPLQGAGYQSLYQAGAYGFIGTLAAVLARDRLGKGQSVEVSHMEGMVSLHQWTTVRYTHGGVVQTRSGNRYAPMHPSTVYACKDGYVAFGAVGNEALSRFLVVAGFEGLLEDARFATPEARFRNADEFDAVLEPWLMEHTAAEVVELAQQVRAPAAPIPRLLDILDDPHLVERGFWHHVPDVAEGLRYPGPPFRMSSHAWNVRRPPRIGEHTRAWLEEAGVAHMDALAEAGITREATE